MMKEHSYDNSLNPDLADNSFQKKLSSMFWWIFIALIRSSVLRG
jgi:hypothetical protein